MLIKILRSTGKQCKCQFIVLFALITKTQTHRTWQTTLRNIIPLPDMNVPFNNPAHLNAYQEFPPGSTVMALYPDTSCFYRAQVVASPKDLNGGGRVSPSRITWVLRLCNLTLFFRVLPPQNRNSGRLTNSSSKTITIKNIPFWLNGSSSTLGYNLDLPGSPFGAAQVW